MARDMENKQRNYKSSIVGGPRGGRGNFEDGQDGIFRVSP